MDMRNCQKNSHPAVKRIFTQKLAIELSNRGFKIVRIERNWNKPWLSVYVFEKTDGLLKALSELTKGAKK